MNRKHHQVTKTPKKVSRNSGGCWKFTSPARLWGSVGSQGVGEDDQTDDAEATWLQERYRAAKAGQEGFFHVCEPQHRLRSATFFSKPWLTRERPFWSHDD